MADDLNGLAGRAPVLPPGMGEGPFRGALRAFAGVVGEAHVLGPEQDLTAYLDPYAFVDPGAFACSAVVLPGSVEEVQAIIRIAAKAGVPLWTVSRGRNLGYGGAAPRLRGSVVLDLGRMNRILEVSEEHGYALIEPGVTFFDLYEYIRERRLKLWISSPALGWGSVVGNALERGIGYTPYGDHANQICGLEVVLGDGEVVRTGMGALPGANTWQLFKGGWGPGLDALFLQSNYGVVTKLGLWLLPQPDGLMSVEVKFQRDDDLEAAVDAAAPLRRREVIQNSTVLASIVRQIAGQYPRSRFYDGEGAMPDEVLEKIRRELGLGWWRLAFNLYGDEPMLDARFAKVRAAFDRIPGAELTFAKQLGGPDGLYAWDVQGPAAHNAGVPGLAALQVLKFRGEDCGHLGFSPILAPKGAEAAKAYSHFKARAHEYGIDYFGGFTGGGRYLHHIFLIIYDKHDPRQTAGANELFGVLAHEAAAQGIGEYRAHVAFMDEVADAYSWNDHALRRTQEKIKAALDPAGVLSPGKQGIWPKGVRG